MGETTRADALLIIDISKAAFSEAVRSMTIKCATLPGDGHRMAALALALRMMEIKLAALRRVYPEVEACLCQLGLEVVDREEAELRAQTGQFR